MNENETQEEYEARLKENGVDVPKEEDPEEDKPEKDPKEDKKIDKEKEEDLKEEDPDKSTLIDEKQFKKRSIYDEYKDKKSELKSEKELREKADGEIQELKTKIEALENAETPIEKKEASDDISDFAEEIGADPEAIKKMQALFLKGVESKTDESLKKDLEEFKAWKTDNKEAIEKQAFETEFSSILPQLKKDFSKVSDEEIQNIKTKLDEISHTKEFHDKSLDYVVFKNQKELSNLVSPRKKGMETKERNDVEIDDFEFDPNVDITKLSPKALEQWEKAYKKAGEQEELLTDGKGGKVMI